MEQDFLPIQSLDIRGEKEINFDLYLRLPLNRKVILYRKAGSQFEENRLGHFIDQNVKNFWIRKNDYGAFVRYVASRLAELVNQPASVSSKQAMLMATRSILASTFQADDSQVMNALMGNLNEIAGVLIESVLESLSPQRKKSYKHLVQLAEQGSDFHKHPVNVSTLSVLIAFGIGYSTGRTLTDVATGALIHDIGIVKLPSRIQANAHTPENLTEPELEQLWRHGELGVELLEERGMPFSEVVRAIMTQHHEKFNGRGYPRHIRGYNINEFAQIVRVADDLDLLLQANREQGAVNLRDAVIGYFDEMSLNRDIEPALSARIKNLFF